MGSNQKFDWLMTFSGTTNASLARAVMVDPSQISRLRCSHRNLSPKITYLKPAMKFIAGRCSSQSHSAVLAQLVGNADIFPQATDEEKADILIAWLFSDGSETTGNSVPSGDHRPDEDNPVHGVRVYRGNAGKRQALWDFCNILLNKSGKHTIKTASDETFDWMFEDKALSQEVAQAMGVLSARGCQHHFVQTAFPTLTFALDNVNKILPILAGGDMQMYYYPYSRDNIYHRTLFVASGVAALTSTTIGSSPQSGVVFLITDKALVDDFDKEFSDYMVLCKPSSRNITMLEHPNFLLSLQGYYNLQGDILQKSASLSLITMPQEVLESIGLRSDPQLASITSRHIQNCRTGFLKNLQDNLCLDYIYLDSPEDIVAGKAKNPWSSLLGTVQPNYQPKEYKAHLLEIASLMEEYPNYCPVLLPQQNSLVSCDLFIKGSRSVFFFRSRNTFDVLEVFQYDMVTAIFDYIRHASEALGPYNRDETLQEIKALAKYL